MPGPPPLVPPPASGRIFRGRRRVRLSDVDAGNRLRLDAIARYLQDVATDDVDDAGWSAEDGAWVVRRTRIDVLTPVTGAEAVELATWCAGVGASAATRRTSIAGSGGGRVETETVWIHLDGAGRPARLAERFHALYAEAARGRRSLDPAHPRRPAAGRRTAGRGRCGGRTSTSWATSTTRRTGRPSSRCCRATPVTLTAVLEYRDPLDLGDAVELATWRDAENSARRSSSAASRGPQRASPSAEASVHSHASRRPSSSHARAPAELPLRARDVEHGPPDVARAAAARGAARLRPRRPARTPGAGRAPSSRRRCRR